MSNDAEHITVLIVKPHQQVTARRRLRANMGELHRALFGVAAARRRLGRVAIGTMMDNPLSVVGQLPETVTDGPPPWAIRTEAGVYAFLGPCAIYNDAGFGAADIGVKVEFLRQFIEFEPSPLTLKEGLELTLKSRSQT